MLENTTFNVTNDDGLHKVFIGCRLLVAILGLLLNALIVRFSIGQTYVTGDYKIPFCNLALCDICYCLTTLSTNMKTFTSALTISCAMTMFLNVSYQKCLDLVVI